MKKKKIYVNKIDKKLDNNQTSCEIKDEVTINDQLDDDKLDIESKLHKLFNTNGYIFNIDVKIITNEKIYYTKIANQVGDNLITLDNDIIKISDIKDIVF